MDQRRPHGAAAFVQKEISLAQGGSSFWFYGKNIENHSLKIPAPLPQSLLKLANTLAKILLDGAQSHSAHLPLSQILHK